MFVLKIKKQICVKNFSVRKFKKIVLKILVLNNSKTWW